MKKEGLRMRLDQDLPSFLCAERRLQRRESAHFPFSHEVLTTAHAYTYAIACFFFLKPVKVESVS